MPMQLSCDARQFNFRPIKDVEMYIPNSLNERTNTAQQVSVKGLWSNGCDMNLYYMPVYVQPYSYLI